MGLELQQARLGNAAGLGKPGAQGDRHFGVRVWKPVQACWRERRERGQQAMPRGVRAAVRPALGDLEEPHDFSRPQFPLLWKGQRPLPGWLGGHGGLGGWDSMGSCEMTPGPEKSGAGPNTTPGIGAVIKVGSLGRKDQ